MKKIILLTLFVFILSAQVNADDRFGVFQINDDYCGVSEEEIIEIQYKDVDNNRESSSGSCSSEWICSEWEPCNSRGYQTRQCIDKWSCPVIIKLPELHRECDVETSSLIQTEENTNLNGEEIIIEPEQEKIITSNNAITGAVIGGKSASWIWVLIPIGITTSLLFFGYRKKIN